MEIRGTWMVLVIIYTALFLFSTICSSLTRGRLPLWRFVFCAVLFCLTVVWGLFS